MVSGHMDSGPPGLAEMVRLMEKAARLLNVAAPSDGTPESVDDGVESEKDKQLWNSLWTHPELSFTAGSIGQERFVRFWEEVILAGSETPESTRRQLLSWVRDGVSIKEYMKPFEGVFDGKWFSAVLPPQYRKANHIMTDQRFRDYATEEFARLEAVGAIRKVTKRPRCVNPVWVVEGRRLRLIVDARFVNLWCNPPDMKYDTLRSFQRGLRKGDFLFSLDFKSGYHHVRLTEESCTYFGLEWQGSYYEFQVLPFGWNVAPYVFNTLSTAVVGCVRSMGIHSLVYLDDFCFRNPKLWPKWKRFRCVWLVMAIMYCAGYTVALDKSVLEPVTRIELLGLGLDTELQQFWVPERKVSTLLGLLDELRAMERVSLKWLQRLVGKAQSLALAIPPVAIFLRRAYEALSKADKSGQDFVNVTEELRNDLNELRGLQSWQRLSKWLDELTARFVMETDASGRGWGGVLYIRGERHVVGGPFIGHYMDLPIHVKELLAIKWTLDAIGHLLRDCFLDLYTDNTIVENTVLKGSAKDEYMRSYSRTLLQFQLDTNVVVRIFRISTSDNVTADGLSRVEYPTTEKVDRNDHMLSKQHFAKLQTWCDRGFTIDACAGSGNKQVGRFISRLPVQEAGCVAVNVFSYTFPTRADGSEEFIYVNPPWPIISGLWAHLRQCKATGVMVFPNQPTAAWYGDVISSAVWVRTLARKGERDVFLQPSRNYKSSVGPVPWDVLAALFDFSE